jgi:hypothetical protein
MPVGGGIDGIDGTNCGGGMNATPGAGVWTGGGVRDRRLDRDEEERMIIGGGAGGAGIPMTGE